MVPGAMAVRQGAAASLPRPAALRLAMSARQASMPMYCSGPAQKVAVAAVRKAPAPPAWRGSRKGAPGEAAAHRPPAAAAALPQPAETFARVVEPVLRLLSVVDGVDARLDLLVDDPANGLADALGEGLGVVGFAAIAGQEHGPDVRRPLDAAGVCREDAVGASLHPAPFRQAGIPAL